jgi:hypothetical protein
MECWFEDRSCTEERKSEGISNREHNKLPEDRKSVATMAIICDSLPRRNTDLRTWSCEIPSKPWHELRTASQCSAFNGKYTWHVILVEQNGKLDRNTFLSVKSQGVSKDKRSQIYEERKNSVIEATGKARKTQN